MGGQDGRWVWAYREVGSRERTFMSFRRCGGLVMGSRLGKRGR